MDYTKNASLFKAAADENRLRIMNILSGGEKCACVLLNSLDIGQSTLSHHMKILCDSGLVNSRKEGKWTHYSLNNEGFERLREAVEDIERIPDERLGCEPIEGKRTKLYVLTGFLGSGKTTLLIKLMEKLKGKKIGVIQNEFGKLGIDGEIIRNDDSQMIEINKGSIFCSCLKLKFVSALAEMAGKGFDYLFVESSGLGDPSNVEEILEATKVISGDCFDFAGAICLVDAVNFFDELSDLETVYRQLKHCNLAVITKTDLSDADTLTAIREKIREINPVCRIDISCNGNLDTGFFNEDLTLYSWAENEDTTNTEETKPKTLFMNFDGEIEEGTLESFISDIEKSSYRIKGFFNIKERGWCQVDVVGDRTDYKPCPAKERSQLVIISRIGPAIIKEIFDAWRKRTDLPMELKN